MKKLYLASQSVSRQQLLQDMQIPFDLLDQYADETLCDWSSSLEQVVTSIATHKMDQVIMPQGNEGDCVFVLTADTLTQDSLGAIHGKPVDQYDFIRQMKALRPESTVATAFCLHKKIFSNNSWQVSEVRTCVVTVRCEFDIPDEWIANYSSRVPILQCAGGMAVESYGMQFVKAIHGSYSGLIGLPVFELRQALQEMNFFKVFIVVGD